MERREFLKVLGGAAAAAGIGFYPAEKVATLTPQAVPLAGMQNVVRQRVTLTARSLYSILDTDVHEMLARARQQAVLAAERLGWKTWESRLIENAVPPGFDAQEWEIILLRLT